MQIEVSGRLQEIFSALQSEFLNADINNKETLQQKFYLVASLLSNRLPTNLKSAQKEISDIMLNHKGMERMQKLRNKKDIVRKLIVCGKRIVQVDESCDIIEGDILKRYLSNESSIDEKKKLERHLLICDKCLKRLIYYNEMRSRIIGMESFQESVAEEENRPTVDYIDELKAYVRDFFNSAHIVPHYLKSEVAFSGKQKVHEVGLWPLSFKLSNGDKMIEIVFKMKGEWLYASIKDLSGLRGCSVFLKHNDKQIRLSNKDRMIIKRNSLGLRMESIDEIKKIFSMTFGLTIDCHEDI